jgi:hypothetical protein
VTTRAPRHVDLLQEVGDVGVEVDLHAVTRAVVEVPEVHLLVGRDDVLHLARRRERVATVDRRRNELGLLLGEVHQRRQRLGQAEEEQVLEAGLHHPLEQRERVVLRRQLRLAKNGNVTL